MDLSLPMTPETGEVKTHIYESDLLDPKTLDEVTELGIVGHAMPDFVDHMKANVTEKYYFGLSTIRVVLSVENPNGETLTKSLVVDHDFHGS